MKEYFFVLLYNSLHLKQKQCLKIFILSTQDERNLFILFLKSFKANKTGDIHINGIEDEDDFDLLSLEGLTDEKEILEVDLFSMF